MTEYVTCRKMGNMGRLGNQLWQLASTIGVADRNGATAILPRWAYEQWFDVPPEFFGDVPADAIEAETLVTSLDERTRGYLQDYGLWSHIKVAIHSYLQPSRKAEKVLQAEAGEFLEAADNGAISVHVRRGDNVPGVDMRDKHRYHPLRPEAYYRAGIHKVGGDQPHVVFFSDDPGWCRTTFADLSPQVFHGVVRPKEHEPEYATAPVLDWKDLLLMTRFHRHVISNSTYSWWGAFLSDDPSPVYPYPWFGQALDYIDSSLMFPKNWDMIDHTGWK